MADDAQYATLIDHKDSWPRWASYMFGFGALLLWVLYNLSAYPKLVYDLCTTPGMQLEAFNLVQFANDVCSTVLSLLIYLMWRSLCFRGVNMRHVWSWKPFFFNKTMMPGGFIPGPAAASVGLLLFVTSTFVSINYKAGTDLQVGDGEWCRADAREFGDASHMWFSRFHRRLPLGCFAGYTADQNFHIPTFFNSSRLNISDPDNLAHPWQVPDSMTGLVQYAMRGSCAGTWAPWCSLFVDETPYAAALLGSSDVTIEAMYTCVYQCISWKVWGFEDLISNAGKIFGGSAIAASLSKWITSRLGCPKVNEKTSPAWITSLLMWSHPVLRCTSPEENKWEEALMASGVKAASKRRIWWHHHLQQNRFLCAAVFLILRVLSNWCFKFTDHGMYSQDFYVTETLVCSVLSALLLRSFNMYWFVPLIYTQKLWEEGSETFVLTDCLEADDEEKRASLCQHGLTDPLKKEGEEKCSVSGMHKIDIDLYMWMHMGYSERSVLLIGQARQISQKDLGKRVQCLAPFEVFTGGKEANEVIKPGDSGTLKKLRDDEATVIWERDGEKKVSGQIDKSYLVESETRNEWTKIIHTYIGNEKEQNEAVKRILHSVEKNNKALHSPSCWNHFKQSVSKNKWGHRAEPSTSEASSSQGGCLPALPSLPALREPLLRP